MRKNLSTGLVGCAGLLGLLAMAACSSSSRAAGGDDGGVDAIAGGGNDAAAGTDGADDAAVTIPDSPAGAELRWLLDLLNGSPAAITEAVVRPHFDQAVLDEVPAGPLAEILAGFATSDAPAVLQKIESSAPERLAVTGMPSGASVVAIVHTGRNLFIRISLVMTSGPAPRIVGLLFSAAPEYDPALRDPATIGARLPAVAATARMLIARVEGDACTPTYALGSTQPMPLGSVFKIYVLGTLAARIGAGQTSWTDMVTIQENVKSLPSGDLQDQPSGTMVSVEDVAAKMISISDNTAADHLIRLVGRENVEAQQAVMGHSSPALNVPFLTTRELFVLKVSATADERAAYIAAAPETRRRLLDENYDLRPLPGPGPLGAWVAPVEIDRLEWFASPEDVCRGFAALKRLGEQPTGAPVFSILSINPAIAVDPAVFSYVGFKGGSEPGVLTFAWLLRRSVDGAWMFVTVGFADGTKEVDTFLGIYYALAAAQSVGH